MKRADIILAAVILAAAFLFLGWRQFTRTEGNTVVVTVDGKETARFALDREVDVQLDGAGGVNRLVIHDGLAEVTDADCPDRLCVKESSIRYSGETIVCLPHKLVVRIESDEMPEVDGVAK